MITYTVFKIDRFTQIYTVDTGKLGHGYSVI